MSPRTFQPSRLGLARKLRGITQKDLAERVEVTPAAVSQYESGAHAPSAETVERLAMVLKCLPEFFFRPFEFDDDVPAFFRSLRRAPKGEQQRARSFAIIMGEVSHMLDVDVALPEVQIPTAFIGGDSEAADIEAAAKRVRELWSVEPGPIANVVRLLEAHGATVVAVGDFDPRLDAFSLWAGSRPVVVLCSDKGVPKRRRFDAAHELGHLVLHRHARTTSPLLERQAHRFAAALLMPEDEIESWLPRRANQIEILRQASEIWGVSMQALLFRARTVGTLSEASFSRAMRRLSVMGWRTDEPVESGPAETPVVLSLAVQALHAGGGSLHGLAAHLGVPYGRLCRMIAVPEERALEPQGRLLELRAAS